MMVGDKAADFSLKDQDGNEFDLYENLDKKVLLVFYPKDNSLVCTKQLTNYKENEKLFDEYGIKIIGINIEDETSHGAFCRKIGADFPVLADVDKSVSKQFDAVNLLGINKRKLVLIGTDKRIIFEKSVLSVFYTKAEEIIKSLKELKLI